MSILSAVLIISNAFDILQKFKTIYIPSHLFWRLILSKLPYLVNETTALISIVTALLFLYQTKKHNELLIIISNGIPLWYVLIIPLITIFVFGVVITAIINPMGAYGLRKYEYIESKLTKRQRHSNVSPSGVFLFEEHNAEHRIIHARSLDTESRKMYDVVILFIDSKNHFIQRIDAKTVTLDTGAFNIDTATIVTNQTVERQLNVTIPTNISMNSIIDNFISPEMISLWNLPIVITALSKSGIPTTHYQIYYYKQLCKPLVMFALTLFTCCLSTLPIYNKLSDNKSVKALLLGFASYIFIEITTRILAAYSITPILAVLFPICMLMLVSSIIMLQSSKTS